MEQQHATLKHFTAAMDRFYALMALQSAAARVERALAEASVDGPEGPEGPSA
jgi:hypothetical protein